MKAALFTAYSVVSEVHRKRFRNLSKRNEESFSDFGFLLSNHFKRWTKGENAYDHVERLREVCKLEQFYEKIASELRDWLIDKAPQTLTQVTKLADEHTSVTNAQYVKTKPVFFFSKTQGKGKYNKAYNNKRRNYFEKHKQGNGVNDKKKWFF